MVNYRFLKCDFDHDNVFCLKYTPKDLKRLWMEINSYDLNQLKSMEVIDKDFQSILDKNLMKISYHDSNPLKFAKTIIKD